MRVESVEQAHTLVQGELAKMSPLEEDEWTIVPTSTVAKPWGWVVFYTSRRYLETGETRYAVAGNAPFIVERETGCLLPTGTAKPLHEYIAAYERTGRPHG